MRPAGRILWSGGVMNLPEPPGAAHIVAQRHRDQREERKEAGANRHLDEIRLILDVHKEQDDDDRLGRRNRQSHNGIQDAEIFKRRGDSNPSEGQKRSEDDDVRLGADDMMFGVLRIDYIRRIVMMVGHGLLLTVYGYTGRRLMRESKVNRKI